MKTDTKLTNYSGTWKVNEINNIKNIIENYDSFLITAHENPDCDALGSTLAMGLGLLSIGKKVHFYNNDKTPDHLKFLPEWERVINDINLLNDSYDCVFLLDSADDMRPGIKFHEFIKNAQHKEKIVIDHHNTNNGDQELVWVDTGAASTGVMIYRLLKSINIEITNDIATLIYATIVGDTGSFRYSNTNTEALKIASELVEYGADPEFVSQAIYENEPLKKINLIAKALNTLEIDESKKIASVYIDNAMYADTGTSREDTEGIINIPRRIEGVSVAVLLRQENKESEPENRWKISLRSKYDVDVSAIAQKFGGGGHVKASGLTIEGDLKRVKETLFETIKEVI